MKKSPNISLTGDPQIDPEDERLKFIAPHQRRNSLQVQVLTHSYLELQTINLMDTINECQNVATQLLANLIRSSDEGRVELDVLKEKGQALIIKVFNEKEPQLDGQLVVDFKLETRLDEDDVLGMRICFHCRFHDSINSTLRGNNGSTLFMQ